MEKTSTVYQNNSVVVLEESPKLVSFMFQRLRYKLELPVCIIARQNNLSSNRYALFKSTGKQIMHDPFAMRPCLLRLQLRRLPQALAHAGQEGKRQAAQDLPRKAAQDLPHQAAQDLPRQQRFPVAWIRRGHSQTHGHHLVPKFESLNLEVEVDLDALFLIYFFICA